MTKPILCLDFDGVIHSYTSGWQGADKADDLIVPGALEFLDEVVKVFRVAIFSTRSTQPGGIHAMRELLLRNGVAGETFCSLEWPTAKPAAFLTLDDRALTFDGTWPSIETLRSVKPWTKR